MDGMGGMMWAGDLRWFLVLALLVLEAAALVKCLFINRQREHDLG